MQQVTSSHKERSAFLVLDKPVVVYQLENGSLRYKLDSVTALLGKAEDDARKYMRILGETTELVKEGRTRVTGLTERQALLYLAMKADNGHGTAMAIFAYLEAKGSFRHLAGYAIRRQSQHIGITGRITKEKLDTRVSDILARMK